MKRFFAQYFVSWWIPLISYIVVFGIFCLGMLFKRDFLIDTALVLFIVNLLGTFVSGIVQVFNKKWYLIIPQYGISALLFYYIGLNMALSPPDYYGANKYIPENIEIYEPLSQDPLKEDLIKDTLVLVNGGQPGIYRYYTEFQVNEKGYFFIKAFEITTNDRLSAERMIEQSKVFIEGLDNFCKEGRFTIYEGSWGDKYAARFELWFQPGGTKVAYKITQRNYIVEGWMR